MSEADSLRLEFENEFNFVTYIAISDEHDFFNRKIKKESNLKRIRIKNPKVLKESEYLKRVLDDIYRRKIIFLNTNVSIYNIFISNQCL